MIELVIRQHRDDSDMVELIERTVVKVHKRPDRSRTTVWGLVHCDCFHDDADIRDKLQAGEEVDVVVSLKIYSGG